MNVPWEAEVILAFKKQFNQLTSYLAGILDYDLDNPTSISQSTAESVYQKLLELLWTTKEILKITHSKNDNWSDFKGLFDQADKTVESEEISTTTVQYSDEIGGVTVKIAEPPILKGRSALSKFNAAFLDDLEQKIVQHMPKNFTKIGSACVIYISYFDKKRAEKRPYFDNDNLAIKAILDTIVPHVCYDDSVVFCDNIYISQPGESCFSEIHIIPKKNYPVWASKNRHLEFINYTAKDMP